MRKFSKALSLLTIAALAGTMAAGCSGAGDNGNSDTASWDKTQEISVYSREDGSGTRGAFIELTGVEQKDADGNKVDMTTTSATVTNSTEVMLTSVSSDNYGIGYVSLGSLNDTVKALKVDGVEATADNIKSGTYKVARPFNIATKGDVSEVAQDFIDFILSADGQKIISDNGYVTVDDSAAAFSGNGAEGKVVVAGSSSVTPVMEKLKEAYEAVNSKAEIEVQQSDSSVGMESAISGACDIGMASRELKDTELAKGLESTVIAKDGIAIIVNKNSVLEDISVDRIMNIYTGQYTTWDKVAE